MLIAKALTRAFDDPSRGRVEAVRGIDVRVEPGEIYGMLGPNGAGKTTTLRLLATLLKPDSGSVEIDGVDALASPVQARARMAYVPAEAGLPEQLTAIETVTLFARIQGVDNATDRALALLDELGATAYAGSACASLSTGMKRRVVLARALVHDPPLLFLDEPTDGLDVAGRRDVLALLQGLAKKGRAVLVCSHIMGEMESLCDRAGIVNKGKMIAEDTIPGLCRQAGVDDLGDAFMAFIGDSDEGSSGTASADEHAA